MVAHKGAMYINMGRDVLVGSLRIYFYYTGEQVSYVHYIVS
jgi:hypothetical protein